MDSIAACKLTFSTIHQSVAARSLTSLAHAAVPSIRGVREMCGNGVQNQPKPAENSEAKCNVFLGCSSLLLYGLAGFSGLITQRSVFKSTPVTKPSVWFQW